MSDTCRKSSPTDDEQPKGMDPELTSIIQMLVPLLMMRTDSFINPAYVAMFLPMYHLGSKVYAYWQRRIPATVATKQVEPFSAFIYEHDEFVYQSILEYCSAWVRDQGAVIGGGDSVREFVLASRALVAASTKREFGASSALDDAVDDDDSGGDVPVLKKRKVQNSMVAFWDGRVPLDVKHNDTTIAIRLQRTTKKKDSSTSTTTTTTSTSESTERVGLVLAAHAMSAVESFIVMCVERKATAETRATHRKFSIAGEYSSYDNALKTRPIRIRKNRLNIFLDDATERAIFDPLDAFLDTASRGQYNRLGWPHKIGFLFEGAPGSGKTSTVYAIAEYVKLPLLLVGSDALDRLLPKLHTIENHVILFDDIDCCAALTRTTLAPPPNGMMKMNDNDDGGEEKKSALKREAASAERPNPMFAKVLELLDGYNSFHNCTVVFATNHPERLDPAIIRPGRIDHRIAFGRYATPCAIRKVFAASFPGESNPLRADDVFNSELSMATITNTIIRANIRDPEKARQAVLAAAQ